MALKFLIDSNVVLDMFLEREPFVTAARDVMALSKDYDVQNFISASSVTDIYYIAYKNLKDHQVVRRHFKTLFEFVEVIKVTGDDIHAAFALNWKDFEDSVQFAVADANKFDGIVTRNMEGFADDSVKIFTPEEVCRHVENCLKE